jgi:hypothetical protein
MSDDRPDLGRGQLFGALRGNRGSRSDRVREQYRRSQDSALPTWVYAVTLAVIVAAWIAWIVWG